MTLAEFSRVLLELPVQATRRGLKLENNDIYDLGVHCLRRGRAQGIRTLQHSSPAPLKNAYFLYFFGGEGSGKLCALWNFLRLTSDPSLGDTMGGAL